MIKVIAMLKRKSGMTIEEFSRYWREKHAPLADTLLPAEVALEQKRYVQNYAVKLPGGGEPSFDGVAEICFNDLESFRKWNDWYFSDDAKPLRDDEENFMDKSKRVIVVTEERVITPS
jgi:uncharacterized protein (TIGR02118 family)